MTGRGWADTHRGREYLPHAAPGLADLANVVLAPHIGSASVETRRKMTMIAAENALAALAGRRPANLLNPEVWDSWVSRQAAAK